MVQKGFRPPGRPREFDPETALQRAMDAFWDGGYSGTSLDDLTDRMGMNRPSLYAAFGDKQALYLKTLDAYAATRRALLVEALGSVRPLREALRHALHLAIDRFLAGDRGARGCYLAGTAATEAVVNPEVRKKVAETQMEIDVTLRDAFSQAKARGESFAEADPQALAELTSAVLHTLALRARAGQPRPQLRRLADSAVDLICAAGSAPRKASKRRPSSK